jgi:DNA helicase-2/ATP-dependent DNA helicase PcrA
MFADDDQAIFGFAGAESANIQKFIKETGAKVYSLTMNYRCTSEIVAVANKLIAASPSSSGRMMKSNKSGGSVEIRTFDSLDKESAQIGAEIAGLVSKGVGTSSLAVLVRSGRRANSLVDELVRRGLPVSDWRGETHTPQGRRVMSACLAAVRGSLNARQTKVLCGLMSVEPCGAMETEAFLEKYSSAPLCKGLNTMRDLVFNGATPHDIARAAQLAVNAQDASLGTELKDLVESVANFQLYDKDFTLEHLLSELALGALGRAPAEGGGIKVASLHRTKGLQWQVVYLLGLEEGHHPDYRAKTAQAIDEERRLCFVGVSRAEQRLVLTRCKVTGGYPQTPSRFLSEMDLFH